MPEANNLIQTTGLKIPLTGGKRTSRLFTSMAEGLNSGLPKTNPSSSASRTWELEASELKVQLGYVASSHKPVSRLMSSEATCCGRGLCGISLLTNYPRHFIFQFLTTLKYKSLKIPPSPNFYSQAFGAIHGIVDYSVEFYIFWS